MHIAHISAECEKVLKVGGLADVVYGLARAQKELGHSVDILLPQSKALNSNILSLSVPSTFSSSLGPYTATWAQLDGINLILIKPQGHFDESSLYGGLNEYARFSAFAHCCVDFFCRRGMPDVFHLHDWHAAIAAPALSSIQGLKKRPHIHLTIHNLSHQTAVLSSAMSAADAVNTVSPTYAKEILSEPTACGLSQFLQRHTAKLSGILNGIDTAVWDPANDPHVPHPYTEKTFVNKKDNKLALQKKLGLKVNPHLPLIVSVGRMVEQKCPHLLIHALDKAKSLGAQFVLLGSSVEPAYTTILEAKRAQYASSDHARVFIGFDDAMGHTLFGAGDMIFIPSLFEPCGLTQLIAFRYGCVPIVRETGGLKDTVFDLDYASVPPAQRTGFSFKDPDIGATDWVLARAVKAFSQHQQWLGLAQRLMRLDFRWTRAAQVYLKSYHHR